MKRILLCAVLVATVAGAFAQTTPLYISKQTGQYTSYQGGYSKSTDKYENGTVTLTPSGPISYTVTPAALSISTNQTKNWQGKIFPDMNNAPAPGTSADAEMTANYNINFSRPQGGGSGGAVTSTYNCEGNCGAHTNGGVHEIVNQTGTQSLKFVVYSLNVTAPDNYTSCPNTEFSIVSEGYPAGGEYKWTAGNNITIVGAANEDIVKFKSTAEGASTLKVEYSIQGVKYTKTVAVNCVKPTVTLSVPDEIPGVIGQQITITPTVTPKAGSVQWAVTGGLKLNSGPYNYVAFVTPQQPGDHTVTLTVNVCNQVITKSVKVKVNPCLVSVPATITVLKGTTATITAMGNMQGNYAWIAGGNAQIQGAANGAAVTIKGTAVGQGWAEVVFTGDGCTDRKRVTVEVLDKPRLRLEPAAIASLCKGERKIITAIYEPAGGTLSWSLSANPVVFYGATGNIPNVVIEAAKGGQSTLTCTYTLGTETATASFTTTVLEYSKVVVTASNNANELVQGTAVTYTAKAYDHTGALAATQPSFHWKVVYIPVGQNANVGNWHTYDLQGNGAQQNYTWGFPQGNFPLPGAGPHKMDAWIEAAEYCTYKSGSVHIKVVK